MGEHTFHQVNTLPVEITSLHQNFFICNNYTVHDPCMCIHCEYIPSYILLVRIKAERVSTVVVHGGQEYVTHSHRILGIMMDKVQS